MVITCLRSQASNCWGWYSHLMPEAGFMSSKVGMIRKPVTLRAVTLSLFTQSHNQLPRYPQDERRRRERETDRERERERDQTGGVQQSLAMLYFLP